MYFTTPSLPLLHPKILGLTPTPSNDAYMYCNVKRGGALVESLPFDQRFAGSNPGSVLVVVIGSACERLMPWEALQKRINTIQHNTILYQKWVFIIRSCTRGRKFDLHVGYRDWRKVAQTFPLFDRDLCLNCSPIILFHCI